MREFANSEVILEFVSFPTASRKACSAIALVLKIPKRTVLEASSNDFLRRTSLFVSDSCIPIPANPSVIPSFSRDFPRIPYPTPLRALFINVYQAQAWRRLTHPDTSIIIPIAIPETIVLPTSIVVSHGLSFTYFTAFFAESNAFSVNSSR